MRFLSEKDRIIYDKLVRYAGGDGRIVVKVLSNPSRKSADSHPAAIDLKVVMKEIEKLRGLRTVNRVLCDEFVLHSTEGWPRRHRPEALPVYEVLSNPDSTVDTLAAAITKMVRSREDKNNPKP